VQNVRREFESKPANVVALDGISLQVREGEIFGVLGLSFLGGVAMLMLGIGIYRLAEKSGRKKGIIDKKVV
jgi:ABC-type methionine transport system ATPase subunit